jgi:tryptophanyl-tRNA synthetase
MGISTSSTSIEEPKNAERCNVFKIYKLLASEEESNKLKAKYTEGNYGYGDAKKELLNFICDKYKTEREKFNYLMENKDILDLELSKGAKKARIIARGVLSRVRTNIGY